MSEGDPRTRGHPNMEQCLKPDRVRKPTMRHLEFELRGFVSRTRGGLDEEDVRRGQSREPFRNEGNESCFFGTSVRTEERKRVKDEDQVVV